MYNKCAYIIRNPDYSDCHANNLASRSQLSKLHFRYQHLSPESFVSPNIFAKLELIEYYTHTQVLFQKKNSGPRICCWYLLLWVYVDTHQTDVQVWCLRIHIIGKKKGCTMCLGSHLVHSVIAGGVIASIVIVACLFWVGLVDHIEAKDEGTALNLPGIPIAVGLYGYCYSGHGMFPNIYSSMKKRSQFPAVIFTW